MKQTTKDNFQAYLWFGTLGVSVVLIVTGLWHQDFEIIGCGVWGLICSLYGTYYGSKEF